LITHHFEVHIIANNQVDLKSNSHVMHIRSLIFALLTLTSSLATAQSQYSVNETDKKLSTIDKQNWHHYAYKTHKVYGAESELVRSTFLKDKTPKKKIVVAVIDSGVDYEHEDFESQIWTNPGEVPENGIDDDNNGFVDDVHGWNFIAKKDGTYILYENLEATRILRLSKELKEANKPYPDWLTKEMLQRAADIYNETNQDNENLIQFGRIFERMDSVAISATGNEEYTIEEVKAVTSENEDIKKAQRFFGLLSKLGMTKEDMVETAEQSSMMDSYYLNLDYNARPNFDPTANIYGSDAYGGPKTGHGTHVSGIIAANGTNELGGKGIAYKEAEIMVLRAVPDGDERDTDVANAIRYAVDNGANIINMSFGKGISPYASKVQDAISYAAKNNVLLVHAAGNDSDNSDEVENYPNVNEMTDTDRSTYITIGATSSRKNKKLLAPFSNYGVETVDLFAPGEGIYATLPENKYGYRSGTSMAAPVVSGVAALVWSYYPDLTASELRGLLVDQAVDISKKKILIPGTKNKAKFNTICKSGKVVSAYSIFEHLSN